MFNREEITEALMDFTQDHRTQWESGGRWFEDQGIKTEDLVGLYSELLQKGPDIMRDIIEEADKGGALDGPRRARADVLVEVFDRAKEDRVFEAVLVTLMMMASGVGVSLMQKMRENEIKWEF